MEDEIVLDEPSEEFESNFPSCKILPLSRLTVNMTGVANGDIAFLSVNSVVRGRQRDVRTYARTSRYTPTCVHTCIQIYIHTDR